MPEEFAHCVVGDTEEEPRLPALAQSAGLAGCQTRIHTLECFGEINELSLRVRWRLLDIFTFLLFYFPISRDFSFSRHISSTSSVSTTMFCFSVTIQGLVYAFESSTVTSISRCP